MTRSSDTERGVDLWVRNSDSDGDEDFLSRGRDHVTYGPSFCSSLTIPHWLLIDLAASPTSVPLPSPLFVLNSTSRWSIGDGDKPVQDGRAAGLAGRVVKGVKKVS